MAYYNVCPICGSNLDPGERCDHQLQREQGRAVLGKQIRADPVTGQFILQLDGGGEGHDERGIASDNGG